MKNGDFLIFVCIKYFVFVDVLFFGGNNIFLFVIFVLLVVFFFVVFLVLVFVLVFVVFVVLVFVFVVVFVEDKVDDFNYVVIKLFMVGIFYCLFLLDKLVYVKVGDFIVFGDIVCIIEVMKLFNEVDVEVSGKIVKVLVEDV